jgi:hypothetical protein
MLAHFRELVKSFEANMTKFYLVLANIILVSFAIWFSNVGLLPFGKVSDFFVFATLSFLLALYRPGWAFVLFVGSVALESVNLMPEVFGIAVRPYQFFGALTIISLIVQIATKRLTFALPKFKWIDLMPILFVLSGFVSGLASADKAGSLKQALIAATFVCLYFLVRIFVQSVEDLKRVVPFFLSSSIVILIYSIWQNVAFVHGWNSFEVMPGRPNGTFAEADWFGLFLVFLLGCLFALIYRNKKNNWAIFGYWSVATLTFVSLILSVSRSAWVGAIFVIAVYLKFVLLGRYIQDNSVSETKWKRFLSVFKFGRWRWREFFVEFAKVITVIIASVLIVYVFDLTKFQLANRVKSTGGLQKITISCESGKTAPEKIEALEELEAYGCRHINLEEIEAEKLAGRIVQEISRPDPNVNIRSQIYAKSLTQIKSHPILGLGWSGISLILGTDERGAGLNASNIFLEVWLGSGFIGFLSFIVLIGFIVVASIANFLSGSKKSDSATMIAFVMFGWAAVVIPNLFNSGIFLGFVWIFLGAAVSLLLAKK